MKSLFKSFCVIIAILPLLFISACNQDPEDEVDTIPLQEPAPWQKSPQITEGLFNSVSTGNEIFAIAANRLIRKSIGNQGDVTSQDFSNFLSRAGRYKIPLAQDRIVLHTERDIRIFPNNSINEADGIHLSVFDLDPNFVSFEFIAFWQGEPIGINNNGVALIPYRSSVNNTADQNPSFFLITTSLVNGKVVMDDYKIIKPTNSTFQVGVSRVRSFDNFFVVQIGTAAVAINQDGTFNEINRITSRAVRVNDEVWTLALNRNNSEMTVYKSPIQSSNWSNAGTYSISNPDIMIADFASVDGQLIAVLPQQLYRLRVLRNSVEIIELDNTNISSGVITSLIKSSDSEVLVTVLCEGQSTDCGIYTKSINNFFAPKP